MSSAPPDLAPLGTENSAARQLLGAAPSPADGAATRGRSPAELWRAARLPIAVAVLVAVAAAIIALMSRQPQGQLDPRAVNPAGSRALAVLLGDHGVRVHRTEGVTAPVRSAGADDTVLVPFPSLLPASALMTLAHRPDAPRLVLVDPPKGALAAVAPGADISGSGAVRVRRPGCSLPVARTAGDTETGGTDYAGGGTSCYDGTLFVTRTSGRSRVTLLGSGAVLTNQRLDHRGNAALALGLLSRGRQLYWVMPGPDGAQLADRQGLIDLLPLWVVPAALQLALAGLLLALWRARRLGPVVAEPLPVIVRAAETVEGRARLYRRGHARDRAAETLRDAARARLVTVLGLGGDPPAAALVEAVHARTARPAEQVADLLYGPAPADDTALVRLADTLDDLIRTTLEATRPVAAEEGQSR